MISHQELSAQQVCSYLMDFEDHFTSHEYKNLYWTSFEKFINDEQPSPECYPNSSLTSELNSTSEHEDVINPSLPEDQVCDVPELDAMSMPSDERNQDENL